MLDETTRLDFLFRCEENRSVAFAVRSRDLTSFGRRLRISQIIILQYVEELSWIMIPSCYKREKLLGLHANGQNAIWFNIGLSIIKLRSITSN